MLFKANWHFYSINVIETCPISKFHSIKGSLLNENQPKDQGGYTNSISQTAIR